MLIVGGIAPERRLSCKVAEDVPLQLATGPAVISIDELFYWRRTDRTHVIEVRIEASTAAVTGVDVVLVPAGSRLRAPAVAGLCSDLEEQRGIPLVDEAPWRARIGPRELPDPMLRFVEEEGSFSLTLGSDGVAVTLENDPPRSMVTNGDVRFLLTGAKALCAIVVGLKPFEVESLRQAWQQQ
jgi:hypothetical protein